jgi:MYXO-CTERM domain-containing protein
MEGLKMGAIDVHAAGARRGRRNERGTANVKMRSLLAWGALTSMTTGVTPSFGAVDASVPDSGPAHTDSGVTPRADAAPPAPAAHPDAGVDSGPPTPSIPVGKACTTAADCEAGLICLLSTSDQLGGAGPAGGLCTVDCSKNGQADCDAVDPGSFCGTFDPAGNIAQCFERCTEGSPVGDAPKCHNRPDMACSPTGVGIDGYCTPTCRGDSDCGKRKCDPFSGLCMDTLTGTLGNGEACDPNAMNDCMGACIQVGGGTLSKANSACSAVCSIGAPGACGTNPDPNASTLPDAACLLVGDPQEGAGDLGGCAQLCDCDKDCLNPSFVCASVPLAAGIGRPGTCVPGTDASGAPVPGLSCGTGTGGAGGKSGAGGASSSTGGGSPDAGAPAPEKDDSSGCGCHVGASSESGRSGVLALAALGLAMLRRRRRSPR